MTKVSKTGDDDYTVTEMDLYDLSILRYALQLYIAVYKVERDNIDEHDRSVCALDESIERAEAMLSSFRPARW